MTEEQLEYYGVYVAFIGAVGLLVLILAIAAVAEVIRDRRALADGPPPAFVCPDCGAQSWNPNDQRFGWCGRCKSYTGRPRGLDIDDRRTA